MCEFNVVSQRKPLIEKKTRNQVHTRSFITGAWERILSPCKPTFVIIGNASLYDVYLRKLLEGAGFDRITSLQYSLTRSLLKNYHSSTINKTTEVLNFYIGINYERVN